VSQLPFDGKGCGAAVVHCSDGRFADQVEDFLRNGLGLQGYDRLALAGGAGHFAAYREEEVAISHLRLLARLRGFTRLILISHEDCRFYHQVLGIDEMDRIRSDLAAAARRIGAVLPHLKFEAYLARLCDDRVWFEPVSVS
jgi:hypothetical protein